MTTQASQQRILIYRLGSLGDTLVVLPAFHLVRRAFPRAHITLLANFPINAKAAPIAAILQNTGLYDDALRYPASMRNLTALETLRKQLRAGKYDCLIYLAKPKGGRLTSVRDYLFFRTSGIRRIIGLPFSRKYRQSNKIPGSDIYRSETGRTIECLRELGAVDLKDPAFWDLRLTSAEISEAVTLLRRAGVSGTFLAASVGTKIQAKDWEEHNWKRLIGQLSAEYPEMPLVLLGVQEEWERSERLMALWQGPKANLCGVSSPRVSAAVLRSALVMVCHDSGPMHLAATVGVPCVAIFSARGKPGEWYPHGEHNMIFYNKTSCWNCNLTTCIEMKKVCILSISVEEVYQAVKEKLSARGVVPLQCSFGNNRTS